MFRNFSLAALIFLGLLDAPTIASDPVVIDLKVKPELSVYAPVLLPSPAFMALALQNAGLPLAFSKSITILSPESIRVGPGTLNYIRQENEIYYYKVELDLPLGGKLEGQVEVNAGALSSGKLQIYFHSALSRLIPEGLLTRVESKLQFLVQPDSIELLISYLKERSAGRANPSDWGNRLRESIAIDALNQSVRSSTISVQRKVGNSEPLSDQYVLIFSVMTWILGLIFYIYLIRHQRKALRKEQDLR
jgi:hypothetical protein